MYLENPEIKDILNSIENQKFSMEFFALILIGEDAQISLKELITLLNRKNINFAGGVFPKIISRNKTSMNGVIIKIIPKHTISIYFDSPGTFTRQIFDFRDTKFSTAYILTSGISSNNSDDIRLLYTYLGNDVKFLGGGAGRNSGNKEEILFSNDGVFQSGTMIILTKTKITSESVHSWKKLFGPFIATKTDKNLIYEINWENAFIVYQRFMKEILDLDIDPQNFDQYSLYYPFGIYKESKNHIIRDLIRVSKEGYLQCAANVDQNSLIDLMTMERQDLKSIPRKLISESIEKNVKVSDALIFNCISRERHLDTDFCIELGQISDEFKNHNIQLDLEGVLSIGEIHSNGEGYPEILNKSVVLGFSYFD
ncbi:FIST signal transduction protein [Labilibaculum sp.]|uniref:FIST signal transduction protein n=1 Tax=Labilibaculum sp. TaxID=2060723 RepID=UPI003562FC96